LTPGQLVLIDVFIRGDFGSAAVEVTLALGANVIAAGRTASSIGVLLLEAPEPYISDSRENIGVSLGYHKVLREVTANTLPFYNEYKPPLSP
jgi:hypothetical protein